MSLWYGRRVETHPQQSDQELVASTLKDRHAFAELVERYEKPLTRYIARLGSRDPEHTKDILQESFIKAYLHLNGYDPALSFSAWMYRIVHNETISHFRSLKNRPRPVEDEKDLEMFTLLADEFDLPAEADRVLLQKSIREGLDLLEPKYRDVVILRFFEEKSYEEISDILEIPSGTVATYLSRAKTKLREILKKSHITDV